MKNDQIKNVSLSFACEKNWNEMKDVEGGRLCDSCQHVVYDFTNQSDCELKKLLGENKRVCGRFKRSQLSSDFLKYAAATMIAASGVAMSSCIEKEIQPDTPEQPKKQQAAEVNELIEIPLPSDTIVTEQWILGFVVTKPDPCL